MCTAFDYLAVVAMITAFICRCVVFSEDAETRPKDPFYYLFAIYLIPLTLFLIAVKLEWRSVAKYMLILRSKGGRGCFLLTIGLLLFEKDHTADKVLSVIVGLCGLANLAVAWIVPIVTHF
jgi:hypothetical protein